MSNNIKQIFVQKIMTDDEVAKLEGIWIDKSYIKHPIIKEDADIYYNDDGIYKLLL